MVKWLSIYLIILILSLTTETFAYGHIDSYLILRCILLFLFFAPFVWKTKLTLFMCTSVIFFVSIYSMATVNNRADLDPYNIFGLFSWARNWQRAVDYIIDPGFKFIYLGYVTLMWLIRPYRW